MSTNVSVVTTDPEKVAIASALAKLAAPTEFCQYKEEQWKFLLSAGKNVQVLVIRNKTSKQQQENDDLLLGCLLRIEYDPDQEAYGMMLVAPQARRQGLAKKLLTTAVNTNSNCSLKILAVCGDMGLPLYQSLGFRRVATVTKMTIPSSKLQSYFQSKQMTDTVFMNHDSHFPSFLELDQTATGMDRSGTLQAIYNYPYVQMATMTKISTATHNELTVAALVTQHTGSSLATVGPILGKEDCVLSLLQGINENLPDTAKEIALIVSDHPTLVQTLKDVGFQRVFELGTMTWNGLALPGKRELYLGLIHPTLG